MNGVNKAILIGNLGADPEVRYTGTGTAVCELRVATNETWKGKDGQKHEKVEWHRVIVWGNDAENAAKYLSKGRPVYVEGRIQTRDYEDKQGQKRYVTEIVAQQLTYLPSGGKGAGQRDDRPEPPDTGSGYGGTPTNSAPDDDIPFATADLCADPSPIAPVLRRAI